MTRVAGAGTLRPIADPDELQAVAELGTLLAHVRRAAGVTQRQLALATGLTTRHVQYLEAGERRTCESTLSRVADFLARFLPDEPEELLELLVEVAGPGLAPESDHVENKDARRMSRQRRAWFAELIANHDGKSSLHRLTRRRSVPEERRRAAQATLHAMRAGLGLYPYD